MNPEAPIDNLDDARHEIERLQQKLAEAEVELARAERDLRRVLPPLPAELEYLNGDFNEILKDALPFDEAFLDGIVREVAFARGVAV